MGETASDKGRRRPRWPWIVVGGLGLVLGLLYVLFPVGRVWAQSMIPTIWNHDYIIGRRGGGVPKRGELVTYREDVSWYSTAMLRVLGLPGDKLTFIDGRPIINGFTLPHCRVGEFWVDGTRFELFVEWLGDYAYGVLLDAPVDGGSCETNADCEKGKRCESGICGVVEGPYEVGPGEMFLVGDFRMKSRDSRDLHDREANGVPIAELVSRPMMVLKGLRGRSFWPLYGPPMLSPLQASLEPALEKCWKQKPPKTSP